MNALAGREVAITSPIPGTTRDLIEVFLDLRGYPVILVDTAGIRDSADPIEQEGVARARRRAESADLTLWLDDGAGGQTPNTGGPTLAVRTKIDLRGADRSSDPRNSPFRRKQAPGSIGCLTPLPIWPKSACPRASLRCSRWNGIVARFMTPAKRWLRRLVLTRRNGN